MKRFVSIALFLAITAGIFGQDIPVAAPTGKIGTDLLDAIRMRTAARQFVKHDLPAATLATIVWAGNGMKTPDAVTGASKAGRTVAYSGDNAYINMYILTSKGTYQYVADKNLLKQVTSNDSRATVTPEFIDSSAFMVLFTADTAKMPSFLGGNVAAFREMAQATAGYASENVALAAACYKIGSIVMYNIKSDAAAAAAKLPKTELPLFIMQAGFLQ
jgi:hypothetical protein